MPEVGQSNREAVGRWIDGLRWVMSRTIGRGWKVDNYAPHERT